MTDSVYAEILKPINTCGLTGIERVIKSERLGDYRITLLCDNFKQYRVTCKDVESKQIVSSILFCNSRIIRFKFTVPTHRNKQLTRQLFGYAQVITRKTFYHSDNLTLAGKASNAL